ncbi:MAG TPA: hypothetical protein VK078_04065 [Pseudogracilibacillus sp.]|nr:hypothetical protein [Pseudogracilibacillus sp.]
MLINYGALIGLYGGAICGLLGWYFGRRKAIKEHSLDELHDYIMKTARSFSWFATLGTIYIFFTLLVIGVSLDAAFSLGILLLVQMTSWGVSIFVLKYYMTHGMEINAGLLAGVSLISLSIVFFVIIAIFTDLWLFILLSIPFSIIGIYFIKQEGNYKKGVE